MGFISVLFILRVLYEIIKECVDTHQFNEFNKTMTDEDWKACCETKKHVVKEHGKYVLKDGALWL